jgi:hypothetical protein
MPRRLVAKTPFPATAAGTSRTVMSSTRTRSSVAGATRVTPLAGLDGYGEVETLRREPEAPGILKGEHDVGRARVGHEACQALVDGGLENEVTVRVGTQLHRVVEAGPFLFGLGGPIPCFWPVLEARYRAGQAYEDRRRSRRRRRCRARVRPLHGFQQQMFGGRTQRVRLTPRPVFPKASAAKGQEIARKLIGAEAA